MAQKDITTVLEKITKVPGLLADLKDIYENGQEQMLIEKLREHVMSSNILSASEQQKAIGDMEKLNASDAKQKRDEDSKRYENSLKMDM